MEEAHYYCPYCGPMSILRPLTKSGEDGGEVYKCVKKNCKAEFLVDEEFKAEYRVEEDLL